MLKVSDLMGIIMLVLIEAPAIRLIKEEPMCHVET